MYLKDKIICQNMIDDCFIIIFHHFDYKSLLQLELVCKRYRTIILRNSELFWYKTPQKIIRSSISNSDCEEDHEISYLLEYKYRITVGAPRFCDAR